MWAAVIFALRIVNTTCAGKIHMDRAVSQEVTNLYGLHVYHHSQRLRAALCNCHEEPGNIEFDVKKHGLDTYK